MPADGNNNNTTPISIIIESDEDDDDILLVREEKITHGLEEDDDVIFIAKEEPIRKRKRRSLMRDAQSLRNSCQLERSISSVVSEDSCQLEKSTSSVEVSPPLSASQCTFNCSDKSSTSNCDTEQCHHVHKSSSTLDEPDSCSNLTLLKKALTSLNKFVPPMKILKVHARASSQQWDIVQGSDTSLDKPEHHTDNNGNCYCFIHASESSDSQKHTCCYHSLPMSTMVEGSTDHNDTDIHQEKHVGYVCKDFLHSKHTALKNTMEVKKNKAKVSSFGSKRSRSKSSQMNRSDDWWKVAKDNSLGNVKLRLIKLNSSTPPDDRNKIHYFDSCKSDEIDFVDSGKSDQVQFTSNIGDEIDFVDSGKSDQVQFSSSISDKIHFVDSGKSDQVQFSSSISDKIHFVDSGKIENLQVLETDCIEIEEEKGPCILMSDSSPSDDNLLDKKDLLCFICKSVCENMSKCNKGHFVCGTCLEVQVKNILAGKTKQRHVKCPDNTCDTVFSFDELKQSVPSFVVDVLEEKFDKAYLQYITDWMFTDEMLKSRSEFASWESPLSTESSVTSNSFVAEDAQTPQNNILLAAREICPNKETLPKYWLPMEHGNNIMVYEVTADTEEYNHLVIPFHETLEFPQYDIIRILRIQNLNLWRYFALKRSEMVEENSGLDVREEQLFHGTHRTYVEAIARKGFDWRLSGKHGAFYGCGSYFAKDSGYSHRYTDRSGDGVSVRHSSHRNVQTFVQGLRYSVTYPSPHILAPQTSMLGLPFSTINQSLAPAQNSSSFLSSTSVNSIGTNSPIFNAALIGPPIHRYTLGSRYKNQLLSQLLSDESEESEVRTPQCHSFNLSAGTSDLEAVFNDNVKPGSHSMFLARVLVGRPARGHSSLKRPPPLDENSPLGKCYDSCVDNLESPKIFVIFDSNQSYPEYLIEYTCT